MNKTEDKIQKLIIVKQKELKRAEKKWKKTKIRYESIKNQRLQMCMDSEMTQAVSRVYFLKRQIKDLEELLE